jgi:hypothetical protein
MLNFDGEKPGCNGMHPDLKILTNLDKPECCFTPTSPRLMVQCGLDGAFTPKSPKGDLWCSAGSAVLSFIREFIFKDHFIQGK